MQRKLISALIFFPVMLLIAACIKETEDPGSGTGGGSGLDCNTVANKAFAADVNPIIQSTCTRSGCHAAGSTNSPGPLITYLDIYNAREKVRSVISLGTMPPGGALTYAQRSYIICWIDSGAPNN
jgi:hypothetical protein